MAQFFPIVRSPNAPFSFLATLDGQQYQCVMTWNLFGQRWYINVYTTGGALVLAIALPPSTNADVINVLAGYFQASSLYYDQPNQQIVVTP